MVVDLVAIGLDFLGEAIAGVIGIGGGAVLIGGAGAVANGVIAVGLFGEVGIDFFDEAVVLVVVKGGGLAVEIGVGDLITVGIIT